MTETSITNSTANKRLSSFDYIVIFVISLTSIALELFLTRILNLKAWNHIVYVVIPFAILGYGIGANIHLIFRRQIEKFKKEIVLGTTCLCVTVFTLLSTIIIIRFPVRVEYLLSLFTSIKSLCMLLAAYSIFMVPFIFVGFLIVYLFSLDPTKTARLYFVDLIGAGIGAVLFFILINTLTVFPSIVLLSLLCLAVTLCTFFPQKKLIAVLLTVVIGLFTCPTILEPRDYVIDKKKGWEWIPGFFPNYAYTQLASKWHPLGRTDVYRMVDGYARGVMYDASPWTFQINVIPRPEFAYISTNFLAGTPAFSLSDEAMERNDLKVKLFSQDIEMPYLLLENPNVLVIGAGGGRDIFMAKTHGAKTVTGAEINPGIVAEMNPNGSLFEYTGGIYGMEGVNVHVIDGRHLVKVTTPETVDLIVLNGVDTFSGLSSGAYAYAESYLYTKNAIKDYLNVLTPNGMINFNRWLFADGPRETLRLHAIALQALKELGFGNPESHIFVGAGTGGGTLLIKRTPFSAEEINKLSSYIEKTGLTTIYPATEKTQKHPELLVFQTYTDLFTQNAHHSFIKNYPYDISVITDDSPFFYKYYKLSSFNPFSMSFVHHTGPIIFFTQTLVLVQAIAFILLFILLPLLIFRKSDIAAMPKGTALPFVTFFSCLGAGFMMIEIPIMQRFVLLLGSPIYSITVVLSTLLIATGLGSCCLPWLQRRLQKAHYLTAITIALGIYVLLLVICGTEIYNQFMPFSFWTRVLMVIAILFPLGFLLGQYFPYGLQLMGERYGDSIAWAWGINGGFSVLGSILSIIIGQFSGFNTMLLLALGVYLISLLCIRNLEGLIKRH